MNQIQQGDVIACRIDALPPGAKLVERINGQIVVMHGESGHVHVVEDVDALFYEKDGKNYLVATKPTPQLHDEHNPIIYEPGIWEIGQVQEKDWLSGLTSRVRD